ncbi:MAG: polysaccharide deacetylase family protein [Flavobacteriales bacterium]|nr:polysaccharide deacetylase family protein [Flavobacteriales bacterium]MCB9362944.1 polysaccharide deacetylase family protein [Flavobacteriales bacterium]
MILVYSHKLTHRLKYIFNVIFRDVLKTELKFTSNIEEYEASELPKINYSYHKLNSGLFFQSSQLLFETGIKEQNITISSYQDYPCFFNVGKDSLFPFDVFAASFYLVSRYEEYLPQIRDNHDRFTAKESLAFQHNFLKTPLINIWAGFIADSLKEAYPLFNLPTQKFEYTSTIDIDNAFAYIHKGVLRIFGGLAKALFKGNDFKERLNVLLNKEQDPYDTYKYQFEIHKKYKIKPVYFFLLGDYALNDKNIPVKNKNFQSLIKSISDYYEIGIHPSYSSNNDVKILTKEINRLQSISHRNITKSRQHFLKLSLPYTYRNLIDNDITHDYTMGYSGQSGFRASICSPYKFYDLDNESATELTIIPFAAMEATYKYYLNKDAQQALQDILELIQTVKSVKGTFVSVWHNESLSEKGIWSGWRMVYEEMLKEATN